MSLSLIKLEFIEYNQPDRKEARKRSRASSSFDQEAGREENIAHFQEQYGSCEFVLRTNAKLLLLLLVAFLLVCSCLIGVFFLLHVPA